MPCGMGSRPKTQPEIENEPQIIVRNISMENSASRAKQMKIIRNNLREISDNLQQEVRIHLNN